MPSILTLLPHDRIIITELRAFLKKSTRFLALSSPQPVNKANIGIWNVVRETVSNCSAADLAFPGESIPVSRHKRGKIQGGKRAATLATGTFPLPYPAQTFSVAATPGFYLNLSRQSPLADTCRDDFARGGAIRRGTGKQWTFKTIGWQRAPSLTGANVIFDLRISLTVREGWTWFRASRDGGDFCESKIRVSGGAAWRWLLTRRNIIIRVIVWGSRRSVDRYLK